MKTLRKVCKVLLAGLLSIVILSILMCGYNWTPVHIENEKGNTDYVWTPNSIWVKMTEGISWGRFDANGLNNASVIENPDMLLLGSSHMEATNVRQNQNTAYYLNKKLCGRYSIYNVSVAGHDLYKVCQYLPKNLELYEPKAVIIETDSVVLTEKDIQKVLSGNVEHTPSYSSGLIGTLQRIPFFRVVYRQSTSGLLRLFIPHKENSYNRSTSNEYNACITTNYTFEEQAYVELFEYLSLMEKKYGTQIIVFYHPTGALNVDGTISFNCDDHLEAFHKYADINGIDFVDLTSEFVVMYYNEHHVAHGFATGRVEYGHINAFGHEKAADALYEKIEQLEEYGVLCQ